VEQQRRCRPLEQAICPNKINCRASPFAANNGSVPTTAGY
jgi:hypothetical protein